MQTLPVNPDMCKVIHQHVYILQIFRWAASGQDAAGLPRILCLSGCLYRWLPSSRHALVCRLIQQHRDELENDIYAEGIEHVRRLLCSDFSSLCPMHALYDTGEL